MLNPNAYFGHHNKRIVDSDVILSKGYKNNLFLLKGYGMVTRGHACISP